MNYSDLRKINVNQHVEYRDGLAYLSWAWAVDQLLQYDPEASWDFPEPKAWNETIMVFCRVSAFGQIRVAQLPVMDYHNRAIINPNAFDMNTAMQRCLAKAIALHGIGLYLYAGEDLPESDTSALLNELEVAANMGEPALRKVWTDIAKQIGKTEADQFWAKHGRALKEMAMKGNQDGNKRTTKNG